MDTQTILDCYRGILEGTHVLILSEVVFETQTSALMHYNKRQSYPIDSYTDTKAFKKFLAQAHGAFYTCMCHTSAVRLIQQSCQPCMLKSFSN